jgi:fructose/tagatose bisphosphate aldolase
MKTLREVLGEARQNEVAVGHFNISDLAGLKAVFESARALRVPVIVGFPRASATSWVCARLRR